MSTSRRLDSARSAASQRQQRRLNNKVKSIRMGHASSSNLRKQRSSRNVSRSNSGATSVADTNDDADDDARSDASSDRGSSTSSQVSIYSKRSRGRRGQARLGSRPSSRGSRVSNRGAESDAGSEVSDYPMESAHRSRAGGVNSLGVPKRKQERKSASDLPALTKEIVADYEADEDARDSRDLSKLDLKETLMAAQAIAKETGIAEMGSSKPPSSSKRRDSKSGNRGPVFLRDISRKNSQLSMSTPDISSTFDLHGFSSDEEEELDDEDDVPESTKWVDEQLTQIMREVEIASGTGVAKAPEGDAAQAGGESATTKRK